VKILAVTCVKVLIKQDLCIKYKIPRLRLSENIITSGNISLNPPGVGYKYFNEVIFWLDKDNF
jgi:hypothetical protein